MYYWCTCTGSHSASLGRDLKSDLDLLLSLTGLNGSYNSNSIIQHGIPDPSKLILPFLQHSPEVFSASCALALRELLRIAGEEDLPGGQC